MRVQRQATHAMWQVQAIRSANVRANAIVLNSAVSAYARNRPPLRTPARQCRVSCNAEAFRPPRPPNASSRHYVVIRHSLRAPSGPDGMVALWQRATSSGPRCSPRWSSCIARIQTTQDSGAKTGGRGSATIEARNPVSAHARGHNLEFRAPVQRRHIQGVGTTSSGGALRKTDVPRRSCSTSSSYSSSSSSMLMAWRSPIDQRATIRMMLNPTYQSPF